MRSSPPPLPVVEARIDRDSNASQRHRDEHPPKRIQIGDQRQDGGLGLGQNALRDLDARSAKRCDTRRATPFYGAAVGQNLARWWHFLGEGSRPDREPLAPLPCGAEVDMDKARARVEAKADEPDLPRGRLEHHRIVVRHGDVEGGAVHMLGTRRASNGAVVLRASICRADDQRLAQPVPQRLQLVEGVCVDQQLAGAAAGDFGG